MRIARKTASAGGKSQKVTGTRRGIRFLRSENKIYKSQTLHITGCTRTLPMLWIRLQLAVLPGAQGTAQPQLPSTTQSPSIAWYQTAGTVRAGGWPPHRDAARRSPRLARTYPSSVPRVGHGQPIKSHELSVSQRQRRCEEGRRCATGGEGLHAVSRAFAPGSRLRLWSPAPERGSAPTEAKPRPSRLWLAAVCPLDYGSSF